MRIFHLSTLADWDAARVSGAYTTSTIGRTLAEEGFIHASRGDQWQGVRERYYADVTEPLVLLVIETDLLTSPVVEEAVPSGELFPHVYGPINPTAVVQTIALHADGTPAATPGEGQSFSALFLGEMMHRMLLAGIVMVLVVVGVLVGTAVEADVGPLLGVVVGFAVGVPLAVLVHRRRERGLTSAATRRPPRSPS